MFILPCSPSAFLQRTAVGDPILVLRRTHFLYNQFPLLSTHFYASPEWSKAIETGFDIIQHKCSLILKMCTCHDYDFGERMLK